MLSYVFSGTSACVVFTETNFVAQTIIGSVQEILHDLKVIAVKSFLKMLLVFIHIFFDCANN